MGVNLSTVNLVAGSKLDVDINLESLIELDFESFEYDPETFPGASVKVDTTLPNILIFSSGKFMIQGAKNENEIKEVIQEFKKRLNESGIISQRRDEVEFDIVNRVFKLELDESLNLDRIANEGLKGEIEYVPEQSPYIVYRPSKYEAVLTISSSGNCVLNGTKDTKTAEKVADHLVTHLTKKNFI